MHPILQELIKKHFEAANSLPEELSGFLAELDQALAAKEEQPAAKMADQTIEQILDSLPFGVTLIAKDKTILHANKNALNTMGYETLPEIVGRICHDNLCPAAEGECPIIDLHQNVNRSERVLITKDREKIPILKSVTPITLNGQEVLLEAFIDISERQQLIEEKEQAYQRRGKLAENTTAVIQKIAAKEQTQELYNTLAAEIADKFDYKRVQVLIYNPAANNLKVVAVAGEDAAIPQAQAAIVPLGRGTIGKAAEAMRPLLAKAPDLNISDYPELMGQNIQTELALPLIIDNELQGILNIQSDQPDQIDNDTLLFLDTLTTQAEYFSQTINFKNEMRDQLNELSILQRMTTTEGWKTFSNLTSLSASRYIYDQNLQTTIPLEEQQTPSSEGALIKPLEIRGQTIGSLGVNTDPNQELTAEEKMLLESVSSEVAEALERARLFETSQRSAAELAVLNDMGSSFSQAQDEETITESIFTYTSQLMETPSFYVALHNPEEDQISFPFIVTNGERVTESHPDFDQWQPRPVGTGLTGHIIKNQQPLLIDSKAEQRLEEMGIPYMQIGGETQSWLGVPMIIGSRVLGVITVQSEDTPNLFNQHHLELLTTIASQAAVAINNTRLLHEQQERAEQEHLVRTVTDKVRRGSDAASIMRVALEELSTILNADISTIQLGDKDSLLAQQEVEPQKNTNPNGKK